MAAMRHAFSSNDEREGLSSLAAAALSIWHANGLGSGYDHETLALYGFDSALRMTAESVVSSGALSSVALHPSLLTPFVGGPKTWAIVAIHNHPSGDSRPSAADIATTRQLAEHLRWIGVSLYDHLIEARDEIYSFRRSGLL